MTEAEKEMFIRDLYQLLCQHDEEEWTGYRWIYEDKNGEMLYFYLKRDPVEGRIRAMEDVVRTIADYLPGIAIRDLWEKAKKRWKEGRKERLLNLAQKERGRDDGKEEEQRQ